MANDTMDLTRVSVKTALDWITTFRNGDLEHYLPVNAKDEFTVLADGLGQVYRDNNCELGRTFKRYLLVDLDTVFLAQDTARQLVGTPRIRVDD